MKQLPRNTPAFIDKWGWTYTPRALGHSFERDTDDKINDVFCPSGIKKFRWGQNVLSGLGLKRI